MPACAARGVKRRPENRPSRARSNARGSLTRQVRWGVRGADQPRIIVSSGAVSHELCQRYRELGMAQRLPKPLQVAGKPCETSHGTIRFRPTHARSQPKQGVSCASRETQPCANPGFSLTPCMWTRSDSHAMLGFSLRQRIGPSGRPPPGWVVLRRPLPPPHAPPDDKFRPVPRASLARPRVRDGTGPSEATGWSSRPTSIYGQE